MPTLSPDLAAVLDVVIDATPDAPVKQDAIAEATGLSVRRVQRHLKVLCEEHGVPVVSRCRAPHGCFIAQSPEEAEDYIAQLRARATSCFRRIRALSAAAARELVADQQQELFAMESPDNTRVGGKTRRLCACGCGEWFPPRRDDQLYKKPKHRWRAANERRS